MPKMTLKTVLAQICVSDLARSEPWYAEVFGTEADRHPMDGLAEWYFEAGGGVQIFQNEENASHGTLTLLVRDIVSEHQRLCKSGLAPGDIEEGTNVRLCQINDSDGNLIVLAEPQQA